MIAPGRRDHPKETLGNASLLQNFYAQSIEHAEFGPSRGLSWEDGNEKKSIRRVDGGRGFCRHFGNR
ncbi:MAG: hypothetical protein ACRCSW_20150, partial [Tabrizicola sp.]